MGSPTAQTREPTSCPASAPPLKSSTVMSSADRITSPMVQPTDTSSSLNSWETSAFTPAMSLVWAAPAGGQASLTVAPITTNPNSSSRNGETAESVMWSPTRLTTTFMLKGTTRDACVTFGRMELKPANSSMKVPMMEEMVTTLMAVTTELLLTGTMEPIQTMAQRQMMGPTPMTAQTPTMGRTPMMGPIQMMVRILMTGLTRMMERIPTTVRPQTMALILTTGLTRMMERTQMTARLQMTGPTLTTERTQIRAMVETMGPPQTMEQTQTKETALQTLTSTTKLLVDLKKSGRTCTTTLTQETSQEPSTKRIKNLITLSQF